MKLKITENTKVKVISSRYSSTIQNYLNDFFSENINSTIVDIVYTNHDSSNTQIIYIYYIIP